MTRLRFTFFFVYLFTLFTGLDMAQVRHQSDNDTLALVNGRPITAADFKKRFELTIYPHKEIKVQLDAEKERFLFSLIAEQLLADDAIKQGKTLTPEANQLEHDAAGTYLRDALYRKEILSKVHVTDKDIVEGVRKATYKYVIDVYYFSDSLSAYAFYRQCLSFNSDQLDSFVTRNRIPQDTMTVGFGDLVSGEEDAFWSHAAGFLSKPINGKGQFAIIRAAKKELDIPFSYLSLQEKKEKIRKLLQRKREVAETERYIDSTFGHVIVQMRKDLMKMLVDYVSLVLKRQIPSQFDLYYNLTQPEIDTLLEMFTDQDSTPMITIQDAHNSQKVRTLTVGDVINRLIPSAFYCKDTSKPAVFSGLDVTLHHLVEYDLLAEQATKVGLENSREVRSNVDQIMGAYYAALMRNSVLDTVQLSQSDLDEFMQKYNASDLKDIFLTLQKFKTRTLDEAVDVYNAVSRLDSTDVHDQRIMLSGMNPDTVRSNAFLLGTIGSFFSQMEPGTIYGPIKKKEGGYTLYKLLSRTTSIPDTSLALAIDTTKMMALSNKQDQVLYRYVASLAAKGNVKVFIQAIKKVQVEPIQMFTVRYIGFGGRISAVPSLLPCEGWVKYVPQKNTIFP